jgi:hypothetical protein
MVIQRWKNNRLAGNFFGERHQFFDFWTKTGGMKVL